MSEYYRVYYQAHKQDKYEYNKARAALSLHKTIKKKCLRCKKYFLTDRSIRRYCSRVCANKAKISNKPKKCAWCGKEFYVSVSQERLRKRKCCSRKCGARYSVQFRKGEKSNLWKGGISSENRKLRYSSMAVEWRKGVFERDNYSCQECGVRGTYLHAHHIKPWARFPEMRFDVSNGKTLCRACHRKEHRKAM